MAGDSKQFIEEIERIFADVLQPDADEMTICNCDECTFPIRGLIGKKWNEVTIDVFSGSISEGISSLSPFALRYYVPGLMIMAITDSEHNDCIMHELLGRFASDETTNQDATHARKILLNMLTSEQRQAIADFFEQYSSEHICPDIVGCAIHNLTNKQFHQYRSTDVLNWAEKARKRFQNGEKTSK